MDLRRWEGEHSYELVVQNCLVPDEPCGRELILLRGNQKFGVPAILEAGVLRFTHECLAGRTTFLVGLRQSQSNLVVEHEFQAAQLLNWVLPGAPIFRALQISETEFLLENSDDQTHVLEGFKRGTSSGEMSSSLMFRPGRRRTLKLPANAEVTNSVLQLQFRQWETSLEIPLIPCDPEDDTLLIFVESPKHAAVGQPLPLIYRTFAPFMQECDLKVEGLAHPGYLLGGPTWAQKVFLKGWQAFEYSLVPLKSDMSLPLPRLRVTPKQNPKGEVQSPAKFITALPYKLDKN